MPLHHEHLHTSGASATSLGILLLLALCLTLLVLYAFAFGRELCRGRRWSVWRASSFGLGMAMVLASLLPPLAPLAHHHLPTHMVQHLLLGMLGPIALVIGMPVTLALRSLPVRAARRLVRILHSPDIRFLCHPATALVLNIGGMAALYMTPLYAGMAEHAVLHALVHFHFLAAGCLFSWSILQLEPAGSLRVSAPIRLAVLFVAIATHATIAKAMYAYALPSGTIHSPAELERAAQIMYYGGDLSELILLLILFATWPRRAVKSQPPPTRGRRGAALQSCPRLPSAIRIQAPAVPE